MNIKSNLAELERQHKALEHEIAEAVAHSSTDDLKIAELRRRKLNLKKSMRRYLGLYRGAKSDYAARDREGWSLCVCTENPLATTARRYSNAYKWNCDW